MNGTPAPVNAVAGGVDPGELALLTLRELSFTLPVRKKLTLEFTECGVRIRNPGTGTLEGGVMWGNIGAFVFSLGMLC
jgi:hypothetical protein